MAMATQDGGDTNATNAQTASKPAGKHVGRRTPTLQTPVLRFVDVPAGHSQSHPIVVTAVGSRSLDLEVISPPLAPFSVVEQAAASSIAPDGLTAKIWIRYDANSPMASDRGRITIGDRVSGQQWTIALGGSGSLAADSPGD